MNTSRAIQDQGHDDGLTLEQRLQTPVFDLQHAQRIREQMRAAGLRIPLTEAERKIWGMCKPDASV